MKIRYVIDEKGTFVPYIDDMTSAFLLPKYCPYGFKVEFENVDKVDEGIPPEIYKDGNYSSMMDYYWDFNVVVSKETFLEFYNSKKMDVSTKAKFAAEKFKEMVDVLKPSPGFSPKTFK